MRLCLLPGANSPAALWEAVSQGRDLTSSTPAGYWRVDPKTVMTRNTKEPDDRTWSDRGGYVQGFDTLFDPTGFSMPAEEINSLDTLVKWVLHTGREALTGVSRNDDHCVGAVFGNLSYPSCSLSSYAEAVWLDSQPESFVDGKSRQVAGVSRPEAINRFMLR